MAAGRARCKGKDDPALGTPEPSIQSSRHILRLCERGKFLKQHRQFPEAMLAILCSEVSRQFLIRGGS